MMPATDRDRRTAGLLVVAGSLVVLALTVLACGGEGGTSITTPTSTPASTAPTTPATGGQSSPLDVMQWDQVMRAAEGTTVRWYMWGGSASINRFVDETYGTALKERYDIALIRIPVSDIVHTVNQILSEKEAGKDPGSVDLLWINGENFLSLKQAGMLYGGWARSMPNSALVDWDNPALNLDFGEPIDTLESPWSSAQFQFIYDSARMDADELPRSFEQLAAWTRAHPGRFTYIAPGPGAFQGTRFVKTALFELSGGVDQWRAFDQATWDRWSPVLWKYLSDLEPYLWRKGETYPKDENELDRLFANNEVDFTVTQAIAGAGPEVDQGLIPATSRAFVFDRYMIGDFNYVAVPFNAPNKAGALVLANLILDPMMQAKQILPSSGFGLGYGIDLSRVTDPEALAALQGAQSQLGPGATPPEDLARALVADAAGQYQTLVEQGWRQNVLRGD